MRKILTVLVVAVSVNSMLIASQVFMANGIKIGEVDQHSAIIWTRLTKYKERNLDGQAFDPKLKREDQRFDDLDLMEAAVPGVEGEVKVTIWEAFDSGLRNSLPWVNVTKDNDFIHQFKLGSLKPSTSYVVLAEGRRAPGEEIFSLRGTFKTAPLKKTVAPITFAVTTCGDYPRRDDGDMGHKIYKHMKKLDLDFFIHAGDIEYYDKAAPWADTEELARFKWRRIFALPNQRNFHQVTPSYFMKDDHETLKNDCWPGQTYGELTFERGLEIFREQVPMGEKTYRTVRWGKDLQIWMVEGRDFRSRNTMKDGPEKTIWGEEQKQWLFKSMESSDATFKVLVSPTPIVGPDRGKKNDNHANKGFTHEGDQIRKFIGSHEDMFIICGDRHWQYASVDPKTGAREFACGSASDAHAGGFKEEYRNEMHKYLKIIGGFLSVEVKQVEGNPQIAFRHHNVDGKVVNEIVW